MLQLNLKLNSIVVTLTIASLTQLRYANCAIIPNSFELVNDALSVYPTQPNEVLPIQPLLIYPKARELLYEGRTSKLDKDDDVIYVQLLKRKNYRPRKRLNDIDDEYEGKELTMKDIFYVKALANGQFSHHRLKVYRLPEFYAISVYHKGEQNSKSS